jgi:hypothetical protein
MEQINATTISPASVSIWYQEKVWRPYNRPLRSAGRNVGQNRAASQQKPRPMLV